MRLANKPDLVQAPAKKAAQPPVYRATLLPAYALDADAFLEPQNQKRIVRALADVLEREAPIRESLLIRRVTQSFGIARAGSRIQRYLMQLLSAAKLQTTTQNGERFYWTPKQDPDHYETYRVAGEGDDKRDARDLPQQEIANAAAAVLQNQIGLPEEDLVRETARLLGYTRLGTSVRPPWKPASPMASKKETFASPVPGIIHWQIDKNLPA